MDSTQLLLGNTETLTILARDSQAQKAPDSHIVLMVHGILCTYKLHAVVCSRLETSPCCSCVRNNIRHEQTLVEAAIIPPALTTNHSMHVTAH